MEYPCDHCRTAEATLIDGDAILWCAPCFDQERARVARDAHALLPLSFNIRAVQRMLEAYVVALHDPHPYPPIPLVAYEKKWAERLGINISPP